MCRILLAKFDKPTTPAELLDAFSEMARTSRTLDDDWQGDGFGISWLPSSDAPSQPEWKMIKSTKPIWEKKSEFMKLPPVSIVMAHARSATFKTQMREGDTSFNQPYLDESGQLSFVFNGHLSGVKLSKPLPGKVGAEKLFNLLVDDFISNTDSKIDSQLTEPIKNLNEFIRSHSTKIHAMNYGISDGGNIYATCNYEPNTNRPDYHRLNVYTSSGLKMVVSEPILGLDYQKMLSGEIIMM